MTLQTAKPNRIPSMDPRPHLTSRYSLGKSKGWKKMLGQTCAIQHRGKMSFKPMNRMYLYSLVSQKSQLKGFFPTLFQVLQIKHPSINDEGNRMLILHLNSSKTTTFTQYPNDMKIRASPILKSRCRVPSTSWGRPCCDSCVRSKNCCSSS